MIVSGDGRSHFHQTTCRRVGRLGPISTRMSGSLDMFSIDCRDYRVVVRGDARPTSADGAAGAEPYNQRDD